MADEETVEIIIKAAVDKAVADIRKFASVSQEGYSQVAAASQSASAKVSEAFRTLRIRSTAEIQKKMADAEAAYKQIAESGTSAPADITRAHQAMVATQKRLTAEMATAHQGATSKIKSAWASAKASWVEIAGVAYTVKKAWDLASEAASFREREQAFTNMAASMGASSGQLLSDLRQLSRGTISEFVLMEKAGTAMTLGIPADKLKGLMEIARATAKVTGQTVSQAFSDLSLAVARQSKMILDNLGIMVNVEKANEDYAKSIKKSASELTDVERKQAFLNATMAAGAEIVKSVGSETDTAAEKFQRAQARIDNFKISLGKGLYSAAFAVESAFAAIGAAVNIALSYVYKFFSYIVGWGSALPFVGDQFKAASAALEGFAENSRMAAGIGWDHVLENIDAIKGMWEKIEAESGAASRAQQRNAEAAADAERDAAEKAAKASKKAYDQSVKASLEAAKADEKILTDRLKTYESFYSEVQQKIQQTYAKEKAHVQELTALYRAKADMQLRTDEMVRGLREITMSPMEKYESQQRAVEAQFSRAMQLSGQEQIDALEQYKQAVAQFANQYSAGITETTQWFGERMALSGKEVIDRSISQIETAAAIQRRVFQEMASEKENQIAADKAWAEALEQSARDVAAEIGSLQAVINDLSANIAAMSTTIELNAVDWVSPVVDQIQRELAALHDKTITITTVRQEVFVPFGGEIPAGPSPAAEGSYAKGTDSVPRTGIYLVHQGERITPEAQAKTEREKISVYDHIRELIASKTSEVMSERTVENNASRSVLERIREIVPQGSYQTGTEYVPRTGPYILHQGERITPEAQAKTEREKISVYDHIRELIASKTSEVMEKSRETTSTESIEKSTKELVTSKSRDASATVRESASSFETKSDREKISVFDRIRELVKSPGRDISATIRESVSSSNIVERIREMIPQRQSTALPGAAGVMTQPVYLPARMAGEPDSSGYDRPAFQASRGEARPVSITIPLGGITIQSAARNAAEMAGELDGELARLVKYNRSRVLAELRRQGLVN